MDTLPVWSVYALIDPCDEQVRYVGKSISVETRVKAHMRERGTTRKIYWLQALQRDGVKPEILILETGTSDWEGAETKWIAHYRALGCDLTNATSGGEGLHNPSIETRALMGSIQRAIWDDPAQRAERMKVYGASWRAAVSKAVKGKKKSPQHIAAMPQNHKGYPWSDEVRAARRACFLANAWPAALMTPPSQADLAHLREMSENNRGKPGWARGRVLSEDERRVRSIAQKGRSKSAEHKEKLRQAALRRWAKARAEKETA